VLAELPGGGWFGAVVSPNEQQLAITRFIAATHSEVWLIDLASGDRRRVLPAPADVLRAAHRLAGWSADGRRLFVVSDRASEFRELMAFELAGGTLERLTRHIAWDVDDVALSRDGRSIAATANVDGRETLHLFDAASGRELPLPAPPSGAVARVRAHPANGELALVIDSSRGPLQIHTLDAQGSTAAWTQPAGTEQVDLSALPEQRIVRWPSFDGRTISGVLSLPPARFAGPRPVLMVMHGGPEGQAKQGWIGRLNYLSLERGIAVLEPNVRGSSGYGKTFLDLDNGRLREDSVRDMAAAIDWIATQPELDAKRVVVYGGSYGGYMALAASVRLADRIAGAVSAVGISNFVSFLENTESYRRDLRRVEYGDERDPAMREFLTSIAPLTLADRITKPLLVVQGRNDPRVPYTESEQIVRSLQRRGRPVWYLLADNEGHGFARRENADFYFATVVRFLEQTLRP
jgi:dipeptidyl aminopeptidase/acylaminoacyl peptidase